MPIEFRCTACNKLLRTPDDTAGKQAKCPECGAVMQIPAAAAAPSPQAGDENPFVGQTPPTGARPEPENPYESPGDYRPAPVSPYAATPGALVPTPIELGDIFRRTWALFTNRYGTSLAIFVVGWLVNFVFNVTVGISTSILGVAWKNPVASAVMSTVGNLATMAFSVWIGIGVALCFLKIARGRDASVGEVFSGGPYFVPIILGTLLFACIMFATVLTCALPATAIAWLAFGNLAWQPRLLVGLGIGGAVAVVPCIVLSLTFSQYYYLILDRRLGVTESFRVSKEITAGNRTTMFLVLLIFSAVGGMFTILTCGLGAIFAVAPYASLLWSVLYLAMTGQATAYQTAPAGLTPFTPAPAASPFPQPGEGQPFPPDSGGPPPEGS